MPDEMSHALADRCLRSGRGVIFTEPEHVKAPAPQNKLRGKPRENKRLDA